MPARKTNVYIVGAGPGDPELITVKGLALIKKADCVLYDHLVAPVLLALTKRSCEKVCVGKRDGSHSLEQGAINRLIGEKAQQHRTVVRLKGGDPFLFAHGYDELKYLTEKGIACEVVPGVTSSLAAPESFGIPLTLKGKLSSIAILAGRKSDKAAPIDAPRCDTLIYMMPVGNITNVVQALKASGRTNDTPCAFIENGTTGFARMVAGTIGMIEKIAKEEKIVSPSVLVVGEAVKKALRKK